MKKFTWKSVLGLSALSAVSLSNSSLDAGCNCQNRSASAAYYGADVYQQSVGAGITPAPESAGLFGPSPNYYGQPQITPMPTPLDGGGYGDGYGGGPLRPMPRGGQIHPVPEVSPGPPPGTIGTTYRRPVKDIPETKHPRAAIIEISGLSADVKAISKGMKGYRGRDGIYRLETKEALTPGIPHIFEVRFENRHTRDKVSYSRFVRLIPGKIIDFEF